MKHSKKILDINEVNKHMMTSDSYTIIKKVLPYFIENQEKYTHDLINDRYYINSYFPHFPSLSWDRFFNNFEKISKGERIPIQADIAVTGRCHCSCWHCFRQEYTKEEPDIKLIKRFINEAYELGTVGLGITGGEPMLRDDILEIIKAIPEGMDAQLLTTGYKLNKEFAKNIKGTSLKKIIISLDHYKKELVRDRRGYDNAFEDVMNALEILSANNIYTAVTCCITEELLREDEILKYTEYVKDTGVDEIRMVLPVPQGKLVGKDFRKLYVNAARYIRALKQELLNKPEYPTIFLFNEFESSECIGCGAGYFYICMNNDGCISPCVAVPLSFGNIKDQDLKEIYAQMSNYYKSPGRTCYGKRISKAVKGLEALEERPINPEASRQLAANYIVKNNISAFISSFINA